MNIKEDARCLMCRKYSPMRHLEQSISFSLAMMDSPGELYDVRVNGSAALELLNSQRTIECMAGNASLLKHTLLFRQATFQVKAVWDETLGRPVMEIVSASLIHD